jgi:hypothetical protein
MKRKSRERSSATKRKEEGKEKGEQRGAAWGEDARDDGGAAGRRHGAPQPLLAAGGRPLRAGLRPSGRAARAAWAGGWCEVDVARGAGAAAATIAHVRCPDLPLWARRQVRCPMGRTQRAEDATAPPALRPGLQVAHVDLTQLSISCIAAYGGLAAAPASRVGGIASACQGALGGLGQRCRA